MSTFKTKSNGSCEKSMEKQYITRFQRQQTFWTLLQKTVHGKMTGNISDNQQLY
jgi:hypothetical protein